MGITGLVRCCTKIVIKYWIVLMAWRMQLTTEEILQELVIELEQHDRSLYVTPDMREWLYWGLWQAWQVGYNLGMEQHGDLT